jgi:hypothetical protein
MTAPADQPSDSLRATPYAIAVILLGLAIFLTVVFLPGGTDAAPAARFATMDAAFGALPDWVTRWMSFQHFVFAGPLLFFVWHAEARVYLLAIIVSHAISFGEIFLAPVERLGLGLVSLNHMVWIPALVFMVLRYPVLDKRTPYSVWYHLALFQLCFSLVFDIRDSALYLAAMLR